MKDSEDDNSKLYARLQHILPYHQTLLRDEARNVAFYAALKRHVTSETRVLDIGSGTGVWAVMAAKLGAKSVTAIEADSTMIPVIHGHIRANGVGDKVKVIHGNSVEVELDHKCDVIVSETIGNQAFDEAIIPTMIDAKNRFLAPKGILIPQTVSLMAAPAHFRTVTQMPVGVPVNTDFFNNLSYNLTLLVLEKDHLEILGKPACLLKVDLTQITTPPPLQGLTGRWDIAGTENANVIAVWAHSELLDGIDIDTFKTTSGPSVAYPFRPLDQKEGEIEFTLNLDAVPLHWTVGISGETAQAYSPVFAYTKMMMESA
ncbi:MAG: 50S ribosomal protein L11 methyltransferase [Pyrinomonadaceae bacterium]